MHEEAWLQSGGFSGFDNEHFVKEREKCGQMVPKRATFVHEFGMTIQLGKEKWKSEILWNTLKLAALRTYFAGIHTCNIVIDIAILSSFLYTKSKDHYRSSGVLYYLSKNSCLYIGFCFRDDHYACY